MAIETGFGAESDAHFTMSIPPWLLAEQVAVHETVQVAPLAQVTLVPAPAVTVHVLIASHCTLADEAACSVQVAPDLQSRFELSPAVTSHVLCEPHCELHDPPHDPVQVVAPSQSNMQPAV
jgi:hypothetical protein